MILWWPLILDLAYRVTLETEIMAAGCDRCSTCCYVFHSPVEHQLRIEAYCDPSILKFGLPVGQCGRTE